MKDNSSLYKDGNLLIDAPFSAKWSWISDKENSNLFSTDSSSQNPITMYYWNTSDAINIALNNPVQSTTTYTGAILLADVVSNIELIWNAAANNWYILSTQGSICFQ